MRLDAHLGGISDGFWITWTVDDLNPHVERQSTSACRTSGSKVVLFGPAACFAAGAVERLGEIHSSVKQRPLITKHCIAGCRPPLFPYSGSFRKCCIVPWPQGVKGNIILCAGWP